MCLILVAWRAHPDYPLVVAANRDELHTRAARAAGWWEQEPKILAGRDLVAGGTWLAVTRDGQFAALTNYHDPTHQRQSAPSRGALVPMMLGSPLPVRARLAQLSRIAEGYNSFNLIFSDAGELAVYESVTGRARVLGAGVYGLSNHLLDTPWPKVSNAKSALSSALTDLPSEHALLELLRDERQADEARLPRTGVSLEWERLLSSAFIRAPRYGTRCSSVILIDRNGQVRFSEWSWNSAGELASEVQFQFQQSDERRAPPSPPTP